MKTRIPPIVTLAVISTCVLTHVLAEEPLFSVEIVETPAAKPPVVRTPMASGFFENLTAEERKAAGMEKLTADQRTALDALVAKEVKLARQGNVRGFAGTFITRRTEEERAALGMGILTTGEKYQLERLVSRALATTTPQPPMSITRPPSEAELLLKTESDWETHGFVQLEYGFGSGDREYKAGTLAVEQVNKKTGTAFTFAYTVAEGDGLWYCRDYSLGWRSRPFGRWSY